MLDEEQVISRALENVCCCSRLNDVGWIKDAKIPREAQIGPWLSEITPLYLHSQH
jgi:hypothetical protein